MGQQAGYAGPLTLFLAFLFVFSLGILSWKNANDTPKREGTNALVECL